MPVPLKRAPFALQETATTERLANGWRVGGVRTAGFRTIWCVVTFLNNIAVADTM